MSFDNLGLEPRLLEAVAKMGYTQPTPIQRDAIPLVLAGRDVVGCAQTGTGKTAAFVLPTLQRIPAKPGGVRALVITPTRELAAQIEQVAKQVGKSTRHRVAVVYGGVGYEPQRKALRQGVDLLVACPGRLLDLVNGGHCDLSRVEVLVLDEADRMLDMGFWPDVRRIISKLPAKRQNLLFSATMSRDVLKVIGDTLARSRLCRRRADRNSCRGHRPVGLPGWRQGQDRAAGTPDRRTPPRASTGLHAHQAPRRPTGQDARPPRDPRRCDPREPLAGPARQGARQLQARTRQGTRRHRCGVSRHRHRRHHARRELRSAQHPRGLRAPHRAHRPCRPKRRSVLAALAGGARQPARHREEDRRGARVHRRRRVQLRRPPCRSGPRKTCCPRQAPPACDARKRPKGPSRWRRPQAEARRWLGVGRLHQLGTGVAALRRPHRDAISAPAPTRHRRGAYLWCWWARMDSNHRPHGYQPCALTN